MDRRTVLKRIGAVAGASGVTAVSAGATEGGPIRATREIDVSDVSGKVRLGAVVEDPETAFELHGRDPSDVRLVVSPSQVTVGAGTQDIGCDLGCCCNAGLCPEDCDDCFCSTCGDCITVA